MFYKSDFPVIKTRKRYKFKKNNKIINVLPENKNKINKKSQSDEIGLYSLFHRYCLNTTLHGFKYISDKEQSWVERLTWMILLGIAIVGVSVLCFKAQSKFSTSPMSTVIESVIYAISEISFPAVTVCDHHRVNWLKFEEAKNFFLPNETNEDVLMTFNLFVSTLDRLEFGSFEEFDILKTRSLKKLEHINITELTEMLAPTCEELFFASCWWRNKYFPCCSIFVKQKSEYGLCYSFNSLVSENFNESNHTEPFPWRTSSYGDWSGLRLTFNNTNTHLKSNSTKDDHGYIVIIHDPAEWPTAGVLIPSGTTTSVVIKPTYSYAASRIYSLSYLERQCVLPLETEAEVSTFQGFKYLQPNCISDCRQRHLIKFCNCTVDYMFPSGNYPSCNINGMMCLNQYDPILNYLKPPEGNIYFSPAEEGLNCSCFPECDRINYASDGAPIEYDDKSQAKDVIDIHFQSATMVKYRTDVVFDWLDLIVAFGGIAGLFMGCSILSFAEVIYYLIIALIVCFDNYFDKKLKKLQKIQSNTKTQLQKY